jgi:gamma-glutamylcyclotransferase (GGCT)/AIG2-like uncharacterized protein YtfP
MRQDTEYLFSYGTLQREAVQLATFARQLEGQRDSLVGYRVSLIPIQDAQVVKDSGDTHYKNIQFTGDNSDAVEGTVFRVSKSELEQADEYEADAGYDGVVVKLSSGIQAWVYLNRTE